MTWASASTLGYTEFRNFTMHLYFPVCVKLALCNDKVRFQGSFKLYKIPVFSTGISSFNHIVSNEYKGLHKR